MPKDPAAVSLGRRGGLVRVPKGAAKLSKAERLKLGKRLALARWGKRK